MIPADRITIEGDTGWLVVPACPQPRCADTKNCHNAYSLLDRPCDICGGSGATGAADDLDDLNYTAILDDEVDFYDCGDCHGTGRHVFEIEVGTACTKSYITGDSEPYNIGTGCACHDPQWCSDDPVRGCDECAEIHPVRTLRVYVVEVLPIVRGSLFAQGRAHLVKRLNPAMDGKQWYLVRPDMNPGEAERLSLPPAAEPGMWAVKLQVVEAVRS